MRRPVFLQKRQEGRIELVWKDDFRNERGYIIERSDGREFAEIARVDADTCSFRIPNLAFDHLYLPRASHNSLGTSDCPTPAASTTPLSGPIIIDHTCIDLEASPYTGSRRQDVLHIIQPHLTWKPDHHRDDRAGLFQGSLCLPERQQGRRALVQPFSGAADLGNRTVRPGRGRPELSREESGGVVVWSGADR